MNPDPHGSALLETFWFRIRKEADADPGSGSALQPMRIHWYTGTTAKNNRTVGYQIKLRTDYPCWPDIRNKPVFSRKRIRIRVNNFLLVNAGFWPLGYVSSVSYSPWRLLAVSRQDEPSGFSPLHQRYLSLVVSFSMSSFLTCSHGVNKKYVPYFRLSQIRIHFPSWIWIQKGSFL